MPRRRPEPSEDGVILTYKYRLKDRAARHLLRRHARAANQVWNWCVAGQKDIQARYDAGAPKRPWPSYIDLSALCNGVGKDLGINFPVLWQQAAPTPR
jgi:hypothetical protein